MTPLPAGHLAPNGGQGKRGRSKGAVSALSQPAGLQQLAVTLLHEPPELRLAVDHQAKRKDLITLGSPTPDPQRFPLGMV